MGRILAMVGAVGAIVLTGAILFMFAERSSFGDALYFSLVTITTVGYGDIVPATRGGRLVASFLMVGGVTSALVIVSLIVSFVVEGRLRRVLGVRRMMKAIESMRDHYIICGHGRLGRQVVRELEAGGSEFVVVEHDPQRVAEAREKGCAVVEGDAADAEVLRKAGLDRCAGVATTISDDAENIYIGLTVRSLRPEVAVVCRSSSTRVRALFERAGIHRTISTEELGARRLVASLTRPHIVDFLDEILRREQGTSSLHAIRLEPGAPLVGQTLEGARLRNEYDIVVLAIRRAGQPILPNPGPRERLEPGDLLIAIGRPEQIERLRTLIEAPAGAAEPAGGERS